MDTTITLNVPSGADTVAGNGNPTYILLYVCLLYIYTHMYSKLSLRLHVLLCVYVMRVAPFLRRRCPVFSPCLCACVRMMLLVLSRGDVTVTGCPPTGLLVCRGGREGGRVREGGVRE